MSPLLLQCCLYKRTKIKNKANTKYRLNPYMKNNTGLKSLQCSAGKKWSINLRFTFINTSSVPQCFVSQEIPVNVLRLGNNYVPKWIFVCILSKAPTLITEIVSFCAPSFNWYCTIIILQRHTNDKRRFLGESFQNTLYRRLKGNNSKQNVSGQSTVIYPATVSRVSGTCNDNYITIVIDV